MASYEIALQLEVSEVPRLIAWVERAAADQGVPASIALRVALALEEAVANVIGHAFADVAPPYVLRVRLDIAPDSLTAEVIDNGREFHPTTAPTPDLAQPIEDRQPGGLGIHLMRGMMDRIDYRRADGLNRLILVKRLGDSPPA